MQLGSKEDESERFNHYLKKTYKKTASLISCSCRAVSTLELVFQRPPYLAIKMLCLKTGALGSSSQKHLSLRV